jgi:hypothetical protein
VIHTGAAFGFRNGDSGEAQCGGLLEEFAGKFALFVVFAGEGLYFGFGEIAHAFLQELLFFGEFEVQRAAFRKKTTSTV